VTATPSPQTAVNAVPGWTAAFPPGVDVVAGKNTGLCEDHRIKWAIECAGGVDGKYVAELGPLDASHTYMLHSAGASRIDAVEANRLAYLRCLIAKEVLSLNRARFHLGDCIGFLEETSREFDLVVGSGVLYHMREPVRLLEAIASRTQQLFLWTHFVDHSMMPPEDPRWKSFTGRATKHERFGLELTLHGRDYGAGTANVSFCGGPRIEPMWMERASILNVLEALGFSKIDIAFENPSKPAGPCFSLFASRVA
ncbi:MAG: class I SAM-dependent methyltransferase, partial [Myxococcota bacterium]